ncbi:D-glycero-D-manno-heptose 1-phosphate guanosyltransferase [Dissulfuribacter thermophilus]|uniref:D-glycero-D-manno-heptose 1-phosphate guanosyltransferase n=1 Tax=Dissulfuribacter thermophilus TaxID=1156395 RepID=A0A1B9F2J6_9BACT|nr:nucleotidyltransferase family protein [Dissulfuribacter thermophilus]OCC14157.1 D-glycero-D-manno-heptose 1-phosphate guanosyltransferase [Dissulfuribacter thermophilus]
MTVKRPKWFKEIFISPEATIRDGMKLLNEKGHQFLLIVDGEERLLGVVSDGDIRRSIAAGMSFDVHLEEIMTSDPVACIEPVKKKEALGLMKQENIRYIPVLDKTRQIVDVITWQDFLIDEPVEVPVRQEPVVIMAGGKGTRLDPFTKILPKPLIPFGDRPMIEWIMDNFAQHGFKEFWVTLNYKKNTIKNYFAGINKDYDVGFVEEDNPLGTAGPLQLLRKELDKTFVVTNCDVVLEEDFSEIVEHHKRKGNIMTIIAVPKHMQIPYGVLEISNGVLKHINEKPEMTYLISAGVYILEPEVLDFIQDGQAIEMPELITRVQRQYNGSVGVFPASGSWFDIGQWKDYQEALIKIIGIKGID